MEPQEWVDSLFSSEQKEIMFPAMERTESQMQIESNFDYPAYFRSQPQKPAWFQSELMPQGFEKMSQHNKTINGIQGFVTLEQTHKGFNMLDQSNNQEIGLPQFFSQPPESQSNLQKNLTFIRSTYTNTNPDFSNHFENFLYVEESNKHKFIDDMRNGYFEMLKTGAKKKSTQALMQSILEFWVGCYRDMLVAIEKCSPLYTLSVFKKEKEISKFIQPEDQPQVPNQSVECLQNQKRKLWTSQQIAKLESIIDSKRTITNQLVHQISAELGRSVVAVQTRIQKIQRQRRISQSSYQNQLIQILKKSPMGMTKDAIALKAHTEYKINEDGFKKHIYPLLNNSRNVSKCKGVFGLKNFNGQLDNLSNFKGKVIACLLEMPFNRGELKSITKKYIEKFAREEGINPEDTERYKSIEANISKTLHKYEVFDLSQSKTIYKYVKSYDNDSVFSSSDWSENQTRKT